MSVLFALPLLAAVCAVLLLAGRNAGNKMETRPAPRTGTMRCPSCGSRADVRGGRWECPTCGDSGSRQ